jgi:hypothetical protein
VAAARSITSSQEASAHLLGQAALDVGRSIPGRRDRVLGPSALTPARQIDQRRRQHQRGVDRIARGQHAIPERALVVEPGVDRLRPQRRQPGGTRQLRRRLRPQHRRRRGLEARVALVRLLPRLLEGHRAQHRHGGRAGRCRLLRPRQGHRHQRQRRRQRRRQREDGSAPVHASIKAHAGPRPR